MGTVDQTTFANPVDRVAVYQSTTLIATAPVAANGSFRIEVPPGDNFYLNVGSVAPVGLVFPRSATSIDQSFSIMGDGAPFDFGTIAFVGDPSSHDFNVHHGGGGSCGCQGSTCGVNDPSTDGNSCSPPEHHGDCGGGDGSGSGSGDGSGGGSGAGSGSGVQIQLATTGDNGPGGRCSHNGSCVPQNNFPSSGCNPPTSGGGTGSGSGSGGGSGAGSGSDGSGGSSNPIQ